MKEIGPAAAVTNAEVATPTTMSAKRVEFVFTPRVVATSSPISMKRSDLASTMAATLMITAIISEGMSDCQVTRLMEPALQKPTTMASSTSARVIRYALIELSMAETPMPTMIKRKPCTPLRHARA